VIAAGQGGTPESRRALAALCEKYWYPLYVFIRRKGYEIEQAQDLTQGFFAQLLDKDYLKDVRRERGKFRSFLLAALKHYMANEWDRSRTQKRGGGQTHVSLDFELAEGRYSLEPVDNLTPDKIYERRWALALLDRALVRLREDMVKQGKEEQFERLRPHLTCEGPRATYRQIADELQTTEGALKVTVHRLRGRFADLVREEIAQTLANPNEIEDEIQYLFSVFR
jgi:RNA polymerase sigma-70 factor (ECF subfamily)